MRDNIHTETGKTMYALANRIDPDSIKYAEGFVGELLNTHEGVQKVAKLLDTVAGVQGVPEYDIFRLVNRKIAAGDYSAGLGARALVAEGLELWQIKESKGMLSLFTNAAGTATDIAKTTILLAAAGGTALGAGYWVLNNKMDEDNPDGQSRVAVEQRLQRYEKAIGNTERKNIKLRKHKLKQLLLSKTRRPALGGSTYEEVS